MHDIFKKIPSAGDAVLRKFWYVLWADGENQK
jgi:hypothetical protein